MGFLHDRVALAGHSIEYFATENVPARFRGRISRLAFPVLVNRLVNRAARNGRPYDIVNVHEPSGAFVASAASSGTNTRVVVTSHGLEERAWALALEEARRGRGGPSLRTRLLYPLTGLWQSRRSLRRAHHIFCLNEDDRSYIVRRYGRDPESITRIYPGADQLFAEASRDRGYETATRILFAATWRENKGIRDLVPAFVEIASRHAHVFLEVLGAGVRQAQILSEFPEPIHDRVRFRQAANDVETAAVFAQADIFLLPSLFEGTPLTLMEAMMSGLPVITTATCGMKDVVREERTGLLVPVRQPRAIVAALHRLLTESGLRERLGRAARDTALANFTWDRVAAPVMEVYERLAGER